jgi:hypothetical protein
MPEIATYVADLLKDLQEGQKHSRWFSRLRAFFDQQFGYDWREKRNELLDRYKWVIWDE